MPRSRPAAVVVLLAGVVFAGLACPAKEERIEVTRGGVAQVLAACNDGCGVKGPNPKDECAKRGAACFWDGAECRRIEVCRLEGHPTPKFGTELQIRMVLFDADRRKIRAKSACTPLLRCVDPATQTSCLADAINQALDGAMPSGLTYDDLEDLSTVLPVLAVFQPRGDEPDGGTSSQCDVDDLIACAGMAVPLGGDGRYDITCAACQDGLLNPPGTDTGPCPRQMVGPKVTSCFLELCSEQLAALQ